MKLLCLLLVLLATFTLVSADEDFWALRPGFPDSAEGAASMKKEWPELVGKDGDEAKQIIQSEEPEIRSVQIVPKGMMVTMDFRQDRVRIWVDEERKVQRPPTVG